MDESLSLECEQPAASLVLQPQLLRLTGEVVVVLACSDSAVPAAGAPAVADVDAHHSC